MPSDPTWMVLGRFVFQREPENQLSSIQDPVARDLKREIGRQRGSEIGGRQRIRGWYRGHRLAGGGSRVILPGAGISCTKSQLEVAQVKVSVPGSIVEQVAESEIEPVRAFGL